MYWEPLTITVAFPRMVYGWQKLSIVNADDLEKAAKTHF
jgi:hypothetical protein